MSRHPFDNDFRITPEQKARFQRDGCVKLEGFLSAHAVDALLDRVDLELHQGFVENLKADALFNRARYDFESDKEEVFQLLGRDYFRKALTDLVERDLFLTYEMCFELEKNVDKGLPWHVGTQSFGYQFAHEFGCTMWAPLHPVDPEGQGGGLAYVPEHVVSGEFLFEQIEPAVVSTMKAKDRAGDKTNVGEYFAMRTGILNSSTMLEILEHHRIEEDFRPGDVLVFNKMVIHRSIMLGEGELPRRAAYVLRFVDAGSHYDLKRAQDLEFPVERFGQGLFAYKAITRQHIEIAEAGAGDGDLLSECAYFGDTPRRMLRREPSPRTS